MSPEAFADQDSMALPGSFDISANGAATYSIPIAVPSGTAGMVPALSLDYSSQSGSGLEGVGWSLSGLPSIGRCPRTQAQDSVRGAVNYDMNDRFCMEGQRLVVISGTYGADGSEYRTEIEGFSKIVAHGAAGNGPAWFEVHTKSGQIMEFGHTTDSLILAQGKTTARAWAVDKISDTAGNYLTVSYTNDTTNGQVYPTRIDYTGNTAAGLAPYNSVQFVYETRPDIVPLYHAGSLQKTTVRLTDIQTYSGATLVDDYKLAYDVSPVTSRSRLTSVKLCTDAAGTSCLPASTFSYSGTIYANGGADGFTVYSNAAGANGQETNTQPVLGDFNGDGKTDVYWGDKVWLWVAGNTVQIQTLPSYNPLLNCYFESCFHPAFAADLNANGKSDLLWSSETQAGDTPTLSRAIMLSNGDGTFNVSTLQWTDAWWPDSGSQMQCTPVASGYSYPRNCYPKTADFDGDGRADFFLSPEIAGSGDDQWSAYGSLIFWYAKIYSPNQLVYQYVSDNQSGGFYAGDNSAIGDFDGDGKSDIFFWVANGTRALWLSNGNQTFRQITNLAGADWQYGDYFPSLGDINGDGKTDIFLFDPSSKSWLVWLSKGDGTFQTTSAITDTSLNSYSPLLLDVNGDGCSDIVWYNTTSNSRLLWLSNGDGTFVTYTNVAAQDGVNPGKTPYVGDFNGDGKPDILWDQENEAFPSFFVSAGTRGLWLSDGVPQDLLASWTTGSGLTTNVTYKALTDASIYTKDADATYPAVDIDGPIYVVSKVEASNGIGGTYASDYTYAGAKGDLNGRGFLGFRQRVVTDEQTGIVQKTNYSQSFPMIGLVTSETKTLGAQTLNSTVNTYTATNLGGTRNFVPLTESAVSSWDLDGSPIPTATTDYSYDAYGNAILVKISTPDGATKTTVNTYTNDPVNWILGRLTAASATNLVPSAAGAPGTTNNPPNAVNDNVSVGTGHSVTFDPRTNDSDPESDPLVISAVSTPAHGMATIGGSGTSVTYTPTSGYSGGDSFTYSISDGQANTATASVTVTVVANQPPVAVADNITVVHGTSHSVTFDPRTNDSDPDGDTLTITAKSTPTGGTVSIVNSGTQLKYTAPSARGTYTFTYTISDGNGHTATATVTATVT